MQFLRINSDTTLSDLSDRVGSRNVPAVLHLNGIDHSVDIGKSVILKYSDSNVRDLPNVSWQKKSSILNTMTTDSDIFEYAATQNESSWKVLSEFGTFPRMLRLPESIIVPDADDTLGNKMTVARKIHKAAMSMLMNAPHYIDPEIFNEYSSVKPSKISESSSATASNVFQWFNIPWGEISLYSSLSGTSIDLPVYPEEISDGVKANYTTMPDLIYQYEPWQLYTGSGPRSNTYDFNFHRDMWTGDHRDGKANEMIRFCMANCYPRYNGSAVDTSIVTLYIHGSPVIRGVMTDVSVSWDGPIGQDGWYLHGKLSLSITEVSSRALNYDAMLTKPLIG